jgi:hypothetical protein
MSFIGKYSTSGVKQLGLFLDPEACLSYAGSKDDLFKKNLELLVGSALSNSTWRKHASGWNAFKHFEIYCEKNYPWPLTIETLRGFVIYCLTCRKITVGTTKTYLASLKLAHELRNYSCVNFSDDRIIKLLYAGTENCIAKAPTIADRRRAMYLYTLLLLGHRIAECNWSKFSKQVIWTACTLAFFTSVRMGEIVVDAENCFDPKTTLLWQNVRFLDSKDILLNLPFTKTTKFQGRFVDVFPFTSYQHSSAKHTLQ